MRLFLLTLIMIVFYGQILLAGQAPSGETNTLQKGLDLYALKQYPEALAALNAAIHDNPKEKDALFTLGVMYENGYGVDRNEVEAAKLYRQAWQAGRTDAYERLNGLYKSALDKKPGTDVSAKAGGKAQEPETPAAKPVAVSAEVAVEATSSEPLPQYTRVFMKLPADSAIRSNIDKDGSHGEDDYELMVSCEDGCVDLKAQAESLANDLGAVIVYSDTNPAESERVRSLLSGKQNEEVKVRKAKLSPDLRGSDSNTTEPDVLTINISCGGWCKVVKKVAEAVVAVYEVFTRSADAAALTSGSGSLQLASIEVNAQPSETAASRALSAKLTNGKYYGLIIGINSYQNINKLKNAVNDAKVVDQILKENYGFENRVLLEDEATRNNIMKALNDLRKKLTENDSLLVFYSGHGEYNKETEASYWLPVDADKDDNTKWLESRSISDQFKLISAKHVLVVADSCFSGTMTRSVNQGLSKNSTRENYLNKLFEKPSRVLIASGGNEPVTDAGGKGHSIFSDVLITALKAPFEPIFTAEELMTRHLKESVAGRTEQTPEYKVVRNSGHDGGDFIFVKKK